MSNEYKNKKTTRTEVNVKVGLYYTNMKEIKTEPLYKVKNLKQKQKNTNNHRNEMKYTKQNKLKQVVVFICIYSHPKIKQIESSGSKHTIYSRFVSAYIAGRQ